MKNDISRIAGYLTMLVCVFSAGYNLGNARGRDHVQDYLDRCNDDFRAANYQAKFLATSLEQYLERDRQLRELQDKSVEPAK